MPNTDTPNSLWENIANHLRDLITSGEIPTGGQIPKANDLAEQFNVTRSTVTKALQALKTEGLIQQRGRSGTVVTGNHELQQLSWESIQSTVSTMHSEIEAEFSPHVAITMSGPGSFAALLSLSLNPRHVPVITTVTFPAGTTSRAEEMYQEAAKPDTWKVLSTAKWRVYLPKTLLRYPEGSRVLIFDDRVISGTTQSLAREHLEEEGYEVATAAMVASSDNKSKLDYYGFIINDNYRMPWGTNRGRTPHIRRK